MKRLRFLSLVYLTYLYLFSVGLQSWRGNQSKAWGVYSSLLTLTSPYPIIHRGIFISCRSSKRRSIVWGRSFSQDPLGASIEPIRNFQGKSAQR
ncbi:hypothetical protein CPB83DRAFT_242255 [Crepidotus variabilis]|uniref:Uncharacterized protein n=1 Tax=Crepidotus variabilis TaxID=179855 RepID=A0A9P6EJQ7_9AGAR|nr:hypothetical protein CPB83DRAFT_242255 [Crepidotus variabilis]